MKKWKSVLHDGKSCYICGTTYNLEEHHIFHGTANRRVADRHGLTVALCRYHHTGDIKGNKEAVHFNHDLDMWLKGIAQTYFLENIGSEEDFRNEYGKTFV